ncbi:MAG TPA: hypothetical protein VGY53_01020, partial [Isosphaeraceae bacterium]|nr:hypothetical protein [Isosphaeraceae bacterium]
MGWLAAFWLLLLRLAIGWHFLYEGVSKIYSTPEGRTSWLARVLPPAPAPPPMEKPEPPFSAEPYLRNATGPLARYFRSLVPDVDSRAKLDLDRLTATWANELERFSAHYHLSAEQLKAAQMALEEEKAAAEAWFHDPENAKRIRKYFDDLTRCQQVLNNPGALESDISQAYRDRAAAETERQQL